MSPRRRFKARRPDAGEDGFTLVESLVALAIVGICLSAIGALAASSLRAVRRVDERLAIVSTLRKVETALPERARLVDADVSGQMNGLDFSLRSTPIPDPSPPRSAKEPAMWTPQKLVLRIAGGSGSAMEIETLRLVPVVTP